MENAVSGISGITDITSSSSTSSSMVVIAFSESTNQDSAANQVASRVSAASRQLPVGINAPVVQTFDPQSIPILEFGISGSGASLGDVTPT